jgi:hypothetical protein
LCERYGPPAGSDAAMTRGRASARLGEAAERETVQALARIADLLNRRASPEAPWRVVHGLRPPRGFPGAVEKAKDEWDAGILHRTDIALLVEVKAAPAAATSDLARLLRGLRRLAHADPQSRYGFASQEGEVTVSGGSLRALQPQGHALPPRVIYCCSAPPEPRAQVLSAASKAALVAEPASLAFGQSLAAGESPGDEALAPVWDALASAARLRSALHQYDSAVAAREAMLHPQDLLAAVESVL